MAAYLIQFYNSVMKMLFLALFLSLVMVGCEEDGKLGSDNSESNQTSAETTPVKPAAVAKIDLNASGTPVDLLLIDDVLKNVDELIRGFPQSPGTKDGSGNSPKNHNKDGDTPLDMTEDEVTKEITKLVIKELLKNQTSDEKFSNDLSRLLSSVGSTPEISLHKAAERGDLVAIGQHIAAGTDINAKDDEDGETPLHRAITRGQTEAAKMLIRTGCDLNVGRTKDGDTPLDMAEGRGRTEIAKLLRDKGAKRNSD